LRAAPYERHRNRRVKSALKDRENMSLLLELVRMLGKASDKVRLLQAVPDLARYATSHRM
jgi:hypothetical protein